MQTGNHANTQASQQIDHEPMHAITDDCHINTFSEAEKDYPEAIENHTKVKNDPLAIVKRDGFVPNMDLSVGFLRRFGVAGNNIGLEIIVHASIEKL